MSSLQLQHEETTMNVHSNSLHIDIIFLLLTQETCRPSDFDSKILFSSSRPMTTQYQRPIVRKYSLEITKMK